MGVRGAISQKPPLEILYNAPLIKEFRISAYAEWPDSMEITFDVLQDCVRRRRRKTTIPLRCWRTAFVCRFSNSMDCRLARLLFYIYEGFFCAVCIFPK